MTPVRFPAPVLVTVMATWMLPVPVAAGFGMMAREVWSGVSVADPASVSVVVNCPAAAESFPPAYTEKEAVPSPWTLYHHVKVVDWPGLRVVGPAVLPFETSRAPPAVIARFPTTLFTMLVPAFVTVRRTSTSVSGSPFACAGFGRMERAPRSGVMKAVAVAAVLTASG